MKFPKHDSDGYGKPRTGSFWKLPASKLWDLFSKAKANFRLLMKIHHPDVALLRGGDPCRCGLITYCWKYMQRVFLKFGIC